MAGKGGGAWKVAYADFVTAMMAFFMVMWLVGQKDSVKEGIAEYFREPPDPFAVFEGNRSSRHTGNKKKSKDHAEAVSPGQLEDNELRRNRGMQIRSSDRSGIGAVVYFDELSDTLSADAKQALQELVPILSGKPQKIEIRGHATRRPLPEDSPFADPWQLCYLRSQAVLHFLIEQGLPAERMRLSQASGFEPLTPRIEPEYQAKNPRVEIFLLNEMAEGQPGSEGAHGDAAHGAPAQGEEHGDSAVASEHGAEPAHGAAAASGDAHGPDNKKPAAKPKAPPAKPAAEAGGHGGGHGEAKPAAPPPKKGPPPLYTPMRKREPPKPAAPEKKSGGHH